MKGNRKNACVISPAEMSLPSSLSQDSMRLLLNGGAKIGPSVEFLLGRRSEQSEVPSTDCVRQAANINDDISGIAESEG
ncbi:MAG: hypothetical protein HY913_00605 [Desulfomonile tiedjei]|nr:hypothetical protein [Desulfomonile tiedjei]